VRDPDALITSVDDTRGTWDGAVDFIDKAADVAGFVDQDVCDYMAAQASSGFAVTSGGLLVAAASVNTTAADALADEYQGASDKDTFVFAVCSTVAFIGEVS
jgi:hypothetical protein